MKNVYLSLLLFIGLSSSARLFAQLSDNPFYFEHVSHVGNYGEAGHDLTGYKTFRVYVQFQNNNNFLTTLFASEPNADCSPDATQSANMNFNCGLFQHEAGSSLGFDLSCATGNQPTLAFDSYLTIGQTCSGQSNCSTTGHLDYCAQWQENFEGNNGDGNLYNGSGFYWDDVSIYSLPCEGVSPALADSNGRVLIGQFTTCGDFSGCFNLQFVDAAGNSVIAYNQCFNACFNDINNDGVCDEDLGCTDPVACNFDPTALLDDNSCCYGICAQLDVSGGNAPEDINWSLLYINGADTSVVVSGGAPFSSALCLPDFSCDYRLVVSDASENGWQGAVYTLTGLSGELYSAGTFNSQGIFSDTLFISVGFSSGCTDPSASNYDSTAVCDNGTCTQCPSGKFPFVLSFSNATSSELLNSELYIIPTNATNQDTLEVLTFYETDIFGCLATGCYSIVVNSPNAATNAGWTFEQAGVGTIYSGLVNQLAFVAFNGATGCELSGCLLPTACNYNPQATTSDGTCVFPGCTDSEACNYSITAGCDDGSCIYPGCNDLTACNYTTEAICYDNVYCLYVDTDSDGVCDDLEIAGCNIANACNFNPQATDAIPETCTFPGCTDLAACNYDSAAGCSNGQCSYPGCFIPGACNYSTSAGCDDGSCVFPGCTDNGACNYDSNAGCNDGSCEFDIEVSLNLQVDSITLQNGLTYGDTVITTPGTYEVITPSPNGCDSIITVTIELQDLNRVTEFTQTGFNIWPNPANSYLNISCPEWTPINMEIMDALGRVVWSAPWMQQIPLFSLAPGMYALRISDGRNSDLKRFEVVR
jgi:hypothetical protein